MNIGEIEYHSIIVSDSRAAKFDEKEPQNEQLYITHHIIRRGATILDLRQPTLELVRHITSKLNTIVLVLIAAGINECTIREWHKGGLEIFVREKTSVWENIYQLKQDIRKISDRALCSIATIPIISLQASQEHYKRTGRLLSSKLSESETSVQQERLSVRLLEINSNIINENKKAQQIGQLGEVRPKQRYWAQNIEKCVTKRKTTGEVSHKRRIPLGALIDGVHANDSIVSIWYKSCHESFKTEREGLEAIRWMINRQ